MLTPSVPNLSAAIFPELTSETSLRSERGASRLAGSISTKVPHTLLPKLTNAASLHSAP